MPTISTRCNIPPFIVMDIMEQARAAEAAGRNILHLEVGEPSRPTHPNIIKAVEDVLKSGTPIGYTVALGIPELRARISKFYMELYGLEVPAERIIVTNGSSGAFSLAFLAAMEQGARLGVPNPGYPAYRHTAKLLDIEAVLLQTSAATHWAPTPEMIAGQKLNALIVASPNNPTGVMLPRQQLGELVQACADQRITIISDEIYHGLTYAFAAETALAFSDDVIVINSFSKFFGLTGWRVGWMVVPEHMVRPIERMTQNLSISVPYLSQIAALHAMDTLKDAVAHRDSYAKCRELLLEGLPKCGFTTFLPPDGAFYVYADVSSFNIDSKALAARLLAECGIAATPGHDFDPINGHKFLRFSYAAGEKVVREALERLQAFSL